MASYLSPLLNGASAIISSPYVRNTLVGAGVTAAAGAVAVFAGRHLKSTVTEKIEDVKTSVAQFATEAGTKVASGAINTVKNQGYLQLITFIEQAQNKIGDATTHRPTNVSAFFRLKDELKALIAANGDQTAIDSKFNELVTQASTTPLYVEGHPISARPGAHLSLTIEDERPEAPTGAADAAALDGQLKAQLTRLTKSLKRKFEIQAVLGAHSNAAFARDLNNGIANDTDYEYDQKFNNVLRAVVNRSSWPSFLRPIYLGYLKVYHYLISIVSSGILSKINQFLDRTLTNFVNQDDRSKLMDLVANVVCKGMHVYTNEIINAASTLSHNSTYEVTGTPDQMFETILAKKPTLHKEMSQKEFYDHILDQALRHCFDWSISRWTLKYLIRKSGYMDNPFLTLPQSIRHNNGYTYSIDKAITKFVEPILRQMTNPARAPAQAGANPAAAAANHRERGYSNLNKETLKKTIQSIFLASDLTQAPNLAAIKRITGIAEERPGGLEAMGIDLNSIVHSTAEAAAQSLLDSLAEIIEPNFVKTSCISALESLNACFGSSEEISQEQYKSAERNRIETLNKLTQVVIGSAIDNAPVLNSSATIDKLNREIENIKVLSVIIKERLHDFHSLAQTVDTPARRTQLIHQIKREIEAKKVAIDAMHMFSEEHKEDMKQALAETIKHFRAYISAFNTEGASDLAKAQEAQRAIAALEAAITTAPCFQPRINMSIMDNPALKKVATFALSAMMKPKFNQVYEFLCDFKTIKYGVIHPALIHAV